MGRKIIAVIYATFAVAKKKNLKKKIHNFVIIILSRVYNEPIQRPAPSWLVSLIGRALHRRSRVRIPYNPEFFSGFLFATAKVAYITAMIFLHIMLQQCYFSSSVLETQTTCKNSFSDSRKSDSSHRKKGNKFQCNLFCNIAATLRVLPARSNLSCNKSD